MVFARGILNSCWIAQTIVRLMISSSRRPAHHSGPGHDRDSGGPWWGRPTERPKAGLRYRIIIWQPHNHATPPSMSPIHPIVNQCVARAKDNFSATPSSSLSRQQSLGGPFWPGRDNVWADCPCFLAFLPLNILVTTSSGPLQMTLEGHTKSTCSSFAIPASESP